MRKSIKLFFGFLLVISGGLIAFSNEKAEAATSGWQSVYGVSGCKVRVWTDYSAYTSSATTIDAYAETNGQCGRLEYKAFRAQQSESFSSYSSESYSGYFSERTPIKSFNLNKWNTPIDMTLDSVYVSLLVYKASDPSKTTLISSLPVIVYKR
ncbi:cell wall-binding protein [Margalitia sp. FSL K6-0131]|uniref:cell wall-binding protein n=1 Tax=Margalitia sp. FSL K6-0131 TaxID=2954604 RepID=UPI0030F8AFB9